MQFQWKFPKTNDNNLLNVHHNTFLPWIGSDIADGNKLRCTFTTHVIIISLTLPLAHDYFVLMWTLRDKMDLVIGYQTCMILGCHRDTIAEVNEGDRVNQTTSTRPYDEMAWLRLSRHPRHAKQCTWLSTSCVILCTVFRRNTGSDDLKENVRICVFDVDVSS